MRFIRFLDAEGDESYRDFTDCGVDVSTAGEFLYVHYLRAAKSPPTKIHFPSQEMARMGATLLVRSLSLAESGIADAPIASGLVSVKYGIDLHAILLYVREHGPLMLAGAADAPPEEDPFGEEETH